MNEKLMSDLTNISSIASNEDNLRNYIINSLKKYNFEVITDKLGSLAFFQKGEGKKIMLVAHLDEVGFIVKHISPQGMLIVIPIGAVRPLSMHMQKVIVTTKENKTVKGILNAQYNESTKTNDLVYVDLGLDSPDEVEKLGVDIGDMVTFDTKYENLSGSRYCSKALDDRCGIYVLIELMKELVNENKNIYYVFSSSEEVGLRGAQTITNIINPDFAYVVDVACARDEFDRSYKNKRQIGKGPMVLHYDKGLLPNRKYLASVVSTAEKHNITIQKDMFVNGGTDGGVVHLNASGVYTVVIAIPNRYGHGPYAIGDYNDLASTIKLLKHCIRETDYEKIQL